MRPLLHRQVGAATNAIVYDTCGGSARLEGYHFKGEQWWRVRTLGHPDRWIRVFDSNALPRLLRNYGFVDGDGCLNQRTGAAQSGALADLRDEPFLELLREMRAVRGVPQRTADSGLCWYCALCFVLFFSRPLRDFVTSYMPPPLRQLCVGVLDDRHRAETLRHHLYHTYAFGDRPGQDPALDGQNGFSQFCVLAAQLDIPVVRLFAPHLDEMTDPVVDQRRRAHTLRRLPRDGEGGLLAVRCFRTRWTVRRRMVYGGRRYRLCAMLIGSEHCGHQIGASTCDLRYHRWALADSDAAQHGIGPMFWTLTRRPNEPAAAYAERWRRQWSTIIPTTNFARNNVCDLNPVNRPTHELERFARAIGHDETPGVVNTDYIYLHLP